MLVAKHEGHSRLISKPRLTKDNKLGIISVFLHIVTIGLLIYNLL
jgi:hypothetical protein